MYGQMTAGSWIYIGSQGIVQGTYETFVEAGRQHYGGDLAGRWILTAGLGGMGGAQPLAATMAGASCLAVECRRARIERRLETRYLDRIADEPGRGAGDDRRRLPGEGGGLGRAWSATPPSCSPRSIRRGVRPGHRHRPDQRPRPAARLPAAGLGRRRRGRSARRAIPPRSSGPPRNRWRRTCARCSTSTAPACRRSTTATTSASWRSRWGSPTRSTSRASSRPTSGRSSAAAAGRSAGPRCRASPRTSGRPTPR